MPSPETRTGSGRRVAWIVLAVFVVLTAIVIFLSHPPAGPAIVPAPPVGRLFFLMVNQPSEHTAALRGLYMVSQQQTKPALFMEELESSGMEDAPRQWISFPRVSPDGKSLAYVSTTYFITEESQTEDVHLALASLAGRSRPKMLLDLTKAHLPAPDGLAWDPKSGRLAFLAGGKLVEVDPTTGKTATTALGASTGASDLAFAGSGEAAFLAGGHVYTMGAGGQPQAGPAADVFAIAGDGRLAIMPNRRAHHITISGKPYQLRWTEPWLIRGRVTSMLFSPSGSYLGYTVTNPLVPEDGLYFLRLSDGKCFRLPYTTTRAGWDWSR